MNIEKEREAFEEWAKGRGMTLHKASPCDGSPSYYLDTASIAAWEAYQAGRAALQSQDRGDAERYRSLRAAAVSNDASFIDAAQQYGFDHFPSPGRPTADEFDASIDHARRVEGEAK